MKKTTLNNIFLLTFLFIKNNTIITMDNPYAYHQNNRKKLCLICSKMVVNLPRHQKSHTDEKPFQCNLYKKTFTRKDSCLEHEKTNNKKVTITNNYQNLIELEPLFNSNEMLNSFPIITHPIFFNQLT